jgi:hypothetical protein
VRPEPGDGFPADGAQPLGTLGPLARQSQVAHPYFMWAALVCAHLEEGERLVVEEL